jgi:acetyl esterase
MTRNLSRDLPPLGRVFAALESLQRRLGKAPTVAEMVGAPLAQRKGTLAPRWMARRAPVDVVATDLEVPSRGGGLPVRTYRAAAGPLPAVAYLHGGGWALGGLDTLDHVCRRMAKEAGVLVASIDYRLAPEHPFPAAIEDCADALGWMRENAGEIGIDPARIAVAGDSAGGNLAAALALHDRDLPGAPPLAAQILIYPALDATMNDPWMHTYRGPGLQLKDCHEIVDFYVSGRPELARDPLVSPLLAEDLSGLPPTLVVTGGVDILRDHGRRYVERLLEAGVQARWSDYRRAPHAFYGMDRILKDGVLAQREVNDELRLLLGSKVAP